MLQSAAEEEQEDEESDGEGFLLKGPRSDLQLRWAHPPCTLLWPNPKAEPPSGFSSGRDARGIEVPNKLSICVNDKTVKHHKLLL